MASLDNLPQCVKECWELLHSEAFFLLLSNFTGLRLHYLCPDDDDDDKDNKEQNEGLKEQDDTQAGGTSGSLVESAADTSRGKGVCVIYITEASVIVCFYLNLSCRAKHARMLW